MPAVLYMTLRIGADQVRIIAEPVRAADIEALMDAITRKYREYPACAPSRPGARSSAATTGHPQHQPGYFRPRSRNDLRGGADGLSPGRGSIRGSAYPEPTRLTHTGTTDGGSEAALGARRRAQYDRRYPGIHRGGIDRRQLRG